MSNTNSCIIKEFPIPDRVYYAAAPARWDEPAVTSSRRRAAPARLRRRKSKPLLPFLALVGLALFAGGFLLGRAEAVGEPSPPAEPLAQWFRLLPEEPETNGDAPVQVQTVPGAVISGGQARTAKSRDEFSLLPEEPAANGDAPVQVQTVPGAVISDGQGRDSKSREDWNLILVNQEHPLPEDFQIPRLTQLRNGHSIDSRAYPELQRMMDAARAQGLEPLICSSYRSWDKQAELFERKVQSCLLQAGSREEAEEQAAVWVARPGTSEHQAGLAVDIVDKSYQMLDEGQEETAVQKWLMAHCAEYGFVLRYPTAKSALTGVGYEPWHYRYVGVEAAREIMDGGLCLEEYWEANKDT